MLTAWWQLSSTILACIPLPAVFSSIRPDFGPSDLPGYMMSCLARSSLTLSASCPMTAAYVSVSPHHPSPYHRDLLPWSIRLEFLFLLPQHRASILGHSKPIQWCSSLGKCSLPALLLFNWSLCHWDLWSAVRPIQHLCICSVLQLCVPLLSVTYTGNARRSKRKSHTTPTPPQWWLTAALCPSHAGWLFGALNSCM